MVIETHLLACFAFVATFLIPDSNIPQTARFHALLSFQCRETPATRRPIQL